MPLLAWINIKWQQVAAWQPLCTVEETPSHCAVHRCSLDESDVAALLADLRHGFVSRNWIQRISGLIRFLLATLLPQHFQNFPKIGFPRGTMVIHVSVNVSLP